MSRPMKSHTTSWHYIKNIFAFRKFAVFFFKSVLQHVL